MRLGQLARKLDLSPTEIITFLAEKNISATEGSNTRITAEQVVLICQKFDPTDSRQIVANDAKKETDSVVSEDPVQEPEVISTEEVKIPELITSSVDEADVVESSEELKTEVIKAPKVELTGLKILGKIELPQPKKKELPVEEQAVEGEENKTEPAPVPVPERKPRRNDDRKFSSSKNSRPPSDKNPIAFHREREAREATDKREEESKKEKEKRTQHYLQKVKSVPTKAARLVDEDVVEMKADYTSAPPKTWVGKFWRWFTS